MDKRRVNVRGIIWQDGKLLAVKHKKADGSEASYWAIPGGGLDPRESLIDGTVRELEEETGVTAKVGKLLFLQQFADPSHSPHRHHEEELEFFYHIENPEDFTAIDLSKTSHGLAELARIEFIDPAKEHILPSFLRTIAIDECIAKDRPVYLHNEID